MSLPNTAISVVHRSDGSGTTSIFTHYLTAVSPDWVTTVGGGDPTKSAAKTVTWPSAGAPAGMKASPRASSQHDGAVGYIDVAYVIQNQIPFADVQNSSGNYITATLSAVAAGRSLRRSRPTSGSTSSIRARPRLPHCGCNLADRLQGPVQGPQDPDARTSLVDFIWWVIHDGQADAPPLDYGALPANLLDPGRGRRSRSINWAGTPLLP